MAQIYVLTREVKHETMGNIKSLIFASTEYDKLLDKIIELRAGAKIRLYKAKFELHYFDETGQLTDSCEAYCD